MGLVLQEEGQSGHNRPFAPLAPMVQQLQGGVIQDGGRVLNAQVRRLMNSDQKCYGLQLQTIIYSENAV